MRVIYIAGPYSAATAEAVARNVQAAAEAGQECMRRGWAVVCPHSMTHGWEHGTGLTYDQFLAADLEILRRCDAVCLVGDWPYSRGTMGEVALADELGLPTWELADVPEVRA